jgi:hypothetical protein
MRLKVKDPTTGDKIYVLACMYPRNRTVPKHVYHPVMLGDECKNLLETISSDYIEAEKYIAAHPWCGKFDVELECHFGEKQVRSILGRLIKDGRITYRGFRGNREYHVVMT